MGLDAWLNLKGPDGADRPGCFRKNRVALLWLACFRVSDIVFDRVHPRSIHMLRCDIGTARRQFEEGLALLRETFPDTDFEIGEEPQPPGHTKIPGVAAFRELLAGMESGHAELPFGYAFGSGIDRFFMHALLGFSYPSCTIFHDCDAKHRMALAAGVTAPGVMTWGDVLRALTLSQVGFVLRQTGEDSRVHPPISLFTRGEYAIEHSLLAGV